MNDYFEVRPLLRHLRVMHRVMAWMDNDPARRDLYAELHCAFMDILAEEFAPHAVTLALAITELEDAFPDILAARDPHA
jgi:hypothetical protein